jgi:hypothetical protein
LHVYWNEWIDFPLLALPWLCLLAVGLVHGFRGLSDAASTGRDRAMTWISIGIALTQLAGGAALLLYLVYEAWNCWICI